MQHFELARIMHIEREREIADALRTRRFLGSRKAAMETAQLPDAEASAGVSRAAGVASASRGGTASPRTSTGS
jgi:hypothetical protein